MNIHTERNMLRLASLNNKPFHDLESFQRIMPAWVLLVIENTGTHSRFVEMQVLGFHIYGTKVSGDELKAQHFNKLFREL